MRSTHLLCPSAFATACLISGPLQVPGDEPAVGADEHDLGRKPDAEGRGDRDWAARRPT